MAKKATKNKASNKKYLRASQYVQFNGCCGASIISGLSVRSEESQSDTYGNYFSSSSHFDDDKLYTAITCTKEERVKGYTTKNGEYKERVIMEPGQVDVEKQLVKLGFKKAGRSWKNPDTGNLLTLWVKYPTAKRELY